MLIFKMLKGAFMEKFFEEVYNESIERFCEMSNFYKNQTGLPVNIWIDAAQEYKKGKHAKRIKFQLNTGKNIGGQATCPMMLNGEIPETLITKVEKIKEISAKNYKIISTGGGAILREENVTNLKKNGKIFYINANLSRLCATQDRPLSDTKEKLAKLFAQRKDIYFSTADVIVPDMKTPQEEADFILTKRLEFL